MKKYLRIALVHDFLNYYGGAERVLEALHDIWPEAPVYTSFVNYANLGPHAKKIRKWHIIESPFGSSWLMKKFHSPLRFLAPLVWNQFDFSDFNVVISSSGWYISRGIKVSKPTIHISYIHHPPRHLYGYQTAVDWQRYFPIKVYGYLVNHFLRMYDFSTAQNVDYLIANSQETRKRIKKFYRRESTVIYPPVEVKKVKKTKTNISISINDYYLVVSRLVRAKHIDLIITACEALDKPLVIVGKGREEHYLKSLKKKRSTLFLGEVEDDDLPLIYTNAKALIFPSEDEEFGIVPVEAMAYGTPVIAYRSGGLIETVDEGRTGIFFNSLNEKSIRDAIHNFEAITNSSRMYKEIQKNCRNRAKLFSKKTFEKKIKAYVSSLVNKNNY